MLTNYWKFPNSECPDIRIRLPRHKWPQSWSSVEDPVVPPERNLYSHPLAGLLWERQFEKILLQHGWEKVSNWREWLFVHRAKGLLFSVNVDDIKLAGKKQNMDPMWKVLQKEVDLGEPTSFLDHGIPGMYSKKMRNKQRYGGQLQNHVRIANFRGRNWKTSIPSKSSHFFMVLWYGGSCKEMCGAILWVSKQDDSTTLQSIYSMHRWQPLQRRRKWNLLENCHMYALKIVLKCWHLARIGRPDILWSVNKLARSITKWTKACDKRLNRLISYIHHTSEYKQYCHVEILLNSADWDCFKTLILREILRIRNPLLVEHCAFLEVIHLFQ